MAIQFAQRDNPPPFDSFGEDDDVGLHASWSERVVTTVAIVVALSIVAAVAILMGMA